VGRRHTLRCFEAVMELRSALGAVVLLCLGTATLAGCATTHTTPAKPILPHVSGSLLTTEARLKNGQREPVTSFTQEDVVVFEVNLFWEPAHERGGVHSVQWRWYQGTRLVSVSTRDITFGRSPYTLSAKRPAALLGSGQFAVAVLVDGALAGASPFEVTPQ
jgi:hypothetical protein